MTHLTASLEGRVPYLTNRFGQMQSVEHIASLKSHTRNLSNTLWHAVFSFFSSRADKQLCAVLGE